MIITTSALLMGAAMGAQSGFSAIMAGRQKNEKAIQEFRERDWKRAQLVIDRNYKRKSNELDYNLTKYNIGQSARTSQAQQDIATKYKIKGLQSKVEEARISSLGKTVASGARSIGSGATAAKQNQAALAEVGRRIGGYEETGRDIAMHAMANKKQIGRNATAAMQQARRARGLHLSQAPIADAAPANIDNSYWTDAALGFGKGMAMGVLSGSPTSSYLPDGGLSFAGIARGLFGIGQPKQQA